MYENYTYENILDTILNRITEADATIDVREGSAMWYAVAPVALELAVAYTNLDNMSKESFVGTATREGIYNACKDIGIDTAQFDATASVFHAHFNIEVTIGSRWICGEYTFAVSSRDGSTTIDGVVYPRYRLVCESVGADSIYTVGNLRPITEYGSSQLRVAVLDECIVPGGDETSDGVIRDLYFDYVKNKSDAGNIAQYKVWLNEYENGAIGAYRIVPAWNGANTVKVIVIDQLKQSPTSEFIESVQTYLDPNKEGLGEGKAPIGAVVTVEGGTNAYIDVKASLVLTDANADISDINDKLAEYFRKIAFAKSTINVYEIASVIMSSPSVATVNSVQLGKWKEGSTTTFSTANLTLNEYECPVLHTFING